MGSIVYYLSLPFIYAVSLMPFWALYLLSDLFYFFIFKVFAYRTKVVYTNLKNAFPEKSEQEIKEIMRKFYVYFCDLTLETLKTLTIHPTSLMKHVQMENEEVFKRFYDQHRSVIIVMGHFGNWELAGARFSQEKLHKLYVIYHPLANKKFDHLVYYMRTRLGNRLYAMNEVLRGMFRDKALLTATAFIADQTPQPQGAYWTQFMNQDTPVFKGTAKIAKKMNYPIIYTSVWRPKRGHYIVKNELLIENPASFSEDEISEWHTRRLEQDIKLQPELWLWTHRRWKHRKPQIMD